LRKDSSYRGAKRYKEVFDEQVEPWILKDENLNLQAITHRFIDDLLCEYVCDRVPAPVVSNALVSLLQIPNLQIMELMSDLRDIRHDIEDMTTVMKMKRS